MTAHVQSPGLTARLNSTSHRAGLYVFGFIVLAHWAEHIVQAIQVFVLDWPRPEAGGVLGLVFPWLVTSEWLHYSYAIVMLIGFWVLRHGFTGRAKKWWKIALWIQVWHHLEHLLLLLQALTGSNLMGNPVPTSVAQLLFPRIELHLFYNAIVFAPMVVAMLYHMRPSASERAAMKCSCKRPA
ncbi:hypothetical protein ALI22I_15025 [Saccharothrix sp. ALI-22-I]|uniref:hypothetical protein n=1 Tax=Saccharothrix sp. ALI-22-I TaxID=1933778 RepID=UPI00097BE7C0|nr:hypothetical protein [Saccharothrix sp. ALI-22-I]ONI89788.1 hypothetical protein ALI22I_15025 [Saccharothrix sp. ALI-22-I]